MIATCIRLLCLWLFLLGAVELGALGASESAESNAGPEAKAHALTAYYQEHTELPRNGAGPWIELVAQAGRPEELRKLSDQIARGRFDVEATIRAVDALAVAALNRQARPTPSGKETEPLANPDYQMLLRLLHSPDAKLRAASARLAGAWRQGYVGQELVSLASAGGSGPETKAAFEALRQIGGKTALAFFSVLARPDQKIETRCHALVAMAEIQLDAAIVKANDVLPAIQDEALATETWRRLLRVDRAANAFAVRLPGDLPRPVIEAGLQESRKLGKAGNSLTRALTRQSEERLRQQ